MSNKPQLHISAINMMNFCGEQFRRRYIENEKLPPGVALLVGRATHKSVSENMEHKKETGSLLPLEQIKQTARDSLEHEWSGSEVALNADEMAVGIAKTKGEAVDKSLRLSALHAISKAPEITPTAVERPWTVELRGYPVDLVGQIDIQEGAKSIRDTKTAKKSPSDNVAETSDQLTAYALAMKVIDGQVPQVVALDYLVDNKVPVAKSFTSKRNDAHFRAFLNRVENAIRAMEKGVFVPVKQSDPMCSPKYCGFYSSCKFTTQPVTLSMATKE